MSMHIIMCVELPFILSIRRSDCLAYSCVRIFSLTLDSDTVGAVHTKSLVLPQIRFNHRNFLLLVDKYLFMDRNFRLTSRFAHVSLLIYVACGISRV